MKLYAIKLEVLEALHDGECFPEVNELSAWCKEQGKKGIGNSQYTAIKNGMPVRARTIIKFLSSFLSRADPNDDISGATKAAASACIIRFLTTQGVPSPQELNPTQMIEHLCASAAQLRAPRSVLHNALFDGISGVTEMFNARRFGYNRFRGARNEQEVRQAVQWFFVDGGSLGVRGIISPDKAIVALEKRFQMSIGEYEAFAIACWRKNPWTILLSQTQGKLVGMSMVLPLRDTVYAKVGGGDLMSCHADPNKFVEPSRHLVLEALSPRPESAGGAPIDQASKAMVTTVIFQIAALSRYALSMTQDAAPLFILAVQGTPDAREGLKKFRFAPTGTKMRTSREPLYEKIIRHKWRTWDQPLIGVLSALSGNIGDRPPP